jgi:hypothetical protein
MRTAYCYHCGKSHPIELMRQLATGTGKRWRCIKSIEAAKVSRETRDDYGRKITKINQADNEHRARYSAAISSFRRSGIA